MRCDFLQTSSLTSPLTVHSRDLEPTRDPTLPPRLRVILRSNSFQKRYIVRSIAPKRILARIRIVQIYKICQTRLLRCKSFQLRDHSSHLRLRNSECCVVAADSYAANPQYGVEAVAVKTEDVAAVYFVELAVVGGKWLVEDLCGEILCADFGGETGDDFVHEEFALTKDGGRIQECHGVTAASDKNGLAQLPNKLPHSSDLLLSRIKLRSVCCIREGRSRPAFLQCRDLGDTIEARSVQIRLRVDAYSEEHWFI